MQRLLLALLALSLTAAVCKADLVTIDPGNHPQPGDEENIFFDQPGLIDSGMTVQGAAHSGAVLDFTANEPIVAAAHGQARITAAAADSGFTDMTIHSTTGVFFSDFIFNVHTVGNASGTLTDTVDLAKGGPVVENFKLDNGENFFTILAASGEDITSVNLSSSVDLNSIEQARLSGIGSPSGSGSGSGGTPTPEPASMLLLGSGLLGLGTHFRKHK